MKRSIKTTILALLIAVTSKAALADDLFSEIAISSVYGADRDVSTDSPSVDITGRRVTGPTSLRKLLVDAGLKADELDSTSVVTWLDAPQTKDGQLKAFVGVNVDKGRLVIGMPLVQVDEKKTQTNALFQLMDAGRNGDGIYFIYGPKEKWLGIRRTLSNENISASSLRTNLNEMIIVAQENVSVWQPLGKTLKSVEKQSSKSSTQQKSKSTSFSLAGSWNATGQSGETFGIRFEGNRFKLGISANGQIVKSEGTWSLKNGRLTLTGEGMTLGGNLTVKSNNQFELKLDNRAALSFTKSS